MMACRKRAVDCKCRVVQDKWCLKYFFIQHDGRPECLICNVEIPEFKEYHLARHFNTRHSNTVYAYMNDSDRRKHADGLRRSQAAQRNAQIRQNTAQRAATLAGYVVAYKIAQKNKPYSEGEFTKHCMTAVTNFVRLENINLLESVGLSQATVTTRVDDIASDLSAQLKQRIEKFKCFSLAMDISADRSDFAQLLIYIRGVDDDFTITEELASLHSLQGTITGEMIYNKFSEGLQNLNAPISKLCNITTDFVPNMIGNISGFSRIFRNQHPNHDVVFFHCIIHQDALFKAVMDISHVTRVIIQLISMIRSQGAPLPQFQDFLMAVDADYCQLLYHSEGRWASCGYMFERVWNIKEEIQDFLKIRTEQWADFKMYVDRDWHTEFAFYTDVLEHYNKLNRKLQGRKHFIDETWGFLRSFKAKLVLLYNSLDASDLTHFTRLLSMEPVSPAKMLAFSDILKKLHAEYETRFQDFYHMQMSLDTFSMPFNVDPETVPAELQLEIIEMQCSNHLKQLFLNTSKEDFYKALPKAEFPKITAHAQKIMAMFASSYLTEHTASTIKLRKNSMTHRLTDEQLFSLLKVTSSQLAPGLTELMLSQFQNVECTSPAPATAEPPNEQ
ncbi:general transcription factor II-I repeat domain-containing protein 2-like [Anticarsia gemmatalis]|uniref:general transcription factor II-I repeat domain-containing protein 2-like n=1 Tax=Anticarsia gemmatalis TaxID=129554 RepID=UPI003F774B2E